MLGFLRYREWCVASRAYSLYPIATFVSKLSLVIDWCGYERQIPARMKYEQRGWRMVMAQESASTVKIGCWAGFGQDASLR